MLILISFWLKTTSNNLQILLLPPYLISSILPLPHQLQPPHLTSSTLHTSSAPPSLPHQLHPPHLISSSLPTSPAPASPYLISSTLSYIVCAGLTSASKEVPVGLKRERGSVCSTRHCLSLRITIYTCFITSTVLRKHRSPTLPPRENPPRPPENPPKEPAEAPRESTERASPSPRQGISAASYTNSGMTIPAKISSTLLTA